MTPWKDHHPMNSKCTATNRRGEPCQNRAITGGTVCRVHGGSSPKVRALAAVRAEVSKWTLGDATDDPGETLLRLLTQSRIRAQQYASLIEAKTEGLDGSIESILVGDSYTTTPDGEVVKTGEYIRALIQLEADERDRCANFARLALAAGLAERTVRVAERQGQQIAQLLTAVIGDDELALSPQQKQAMPNALRRHLSLVLDAQTRSEN